jgi:hypothetical protein
LRLGKAIGYISDESRACGLAPVGGVTISVPANPPLDGDFGRSGCWRERGVELFSSAAGGWRRRHGFSHSLTFASNLML